jgi:hypothetical protein
MTGLVITVLAVALVGGGFAASSYRTRAGWVVDQPVPFSHKHHVGDDGIDCRYCHSGVETSANAGLPPTHTCMTCHSQLFTQAPVLAPVRRSYSDNSPIDWNRVAQLPDYVYFNHSIHIARGVACVECHGRIDKMALTYRAKAFTMKFCLECHRDPAPHLRPPDEVTRMDWSSWSGAHKRRYGEAALRRYHINVAALDNCEICHR